MSLAPGRGTEDPSLSIMATPCLRPPSAFCRAGKQEQAGPCNTHQLNVDLLLSASSKIPREQPKEPWGSQIADHSLDEEKPKVQAPLGALARRPSHPSCHCDKWPTKIFLEATGRIPPSASLAVVPAFPRASALEGTLRRLISGKHLRTPHCLPVAKSRSEWHATYVDNHHDRRGRLSGKPAPSLPTVGRSDWVSSSS